MHWNGFFLIFNDVKSSKAGSVSGSGSIAKKNADPQPWNLKKLLKVEAALTIQKLCGAVKISFLCGSL